VLIPLFAHRCATWFSRLLNVWRDPHASMVASAVSASPPSSADGVAAASLFICRARLLQNARASVQRMPQHAMEHVRSHETITSRLWRWTRMEPLRAYLVFRHILIARYFVLSFRCLLAQHHHHRGPYKLEGVEKAMERRTDAVQASALAPGCQVRGAQPYRLTRLMPLRWAFLLWLWLVWFLDLAPPRSRSRSRSKSVVAAAKPPAGTRPSRDAPHAHSLPAARLPARAPATRPPAAPGGWLAAHAEHAATSTASPSRISAVAAIFQPPRHLASAAPCPARGGRAESPASLGSPAGRRPKVQQLAPPVRHEPRNLGPLNLAWAMTEGSEAPLLGWNR